MGAGVGAGVGVDVKARMSSIDAGIREHAGVRCSGVDAGVHSGVNADIAHPCLNADSYTGALTAFHTFNQFGIAHPDPHVCPGSELGPH